MRGGLTYDGGDDDEQQNHVAREDGDGHDADEHGEHESVDGAAHRHHLHHHLQHVTNTSSPVSNFGLDACNKSFANIVCF